MSESENVYYILTIYMYDRVMRKKGMSKFILIFLAMISSVAFCQITMQDDLIRRIKNVSGSLGNSLSGMISQPASKTFYQEMLEDFCKANYNIRFRNRSYVYGSLRVDGFHSLSSNIVEVWGTHSYKFIKSHNNRDFKATIRTEGKNKYQIKFEKKSDIPLVSWESTDVPFTYTP